MKHPSAIALALAAMLAAAPAAAASSSCSVHSGAVAQPLVELYTSEGCSSCPPAERTLAKMIAAPGGGTWHALALHVDYWDYIGWMDPYALPVSAERQRRLVQANGHATVYTPHFFVNGVETEGSEGALRAELARLQAAPSAAGIALDVARSSTGALSVSASADAPRRDGNLALYVALAEDHLVSRIARGENGGSTLTHEHVLRSWLGPFALADGKAAMRHDLNAAESARYTHGELVAFVQDEQSARVLQSVELPYCTP